MAQGLTSTQEIVEVRLDNIHARLDKGRARTGTRSLTAPKHRALSSVAGGNEFNGVIRVVAVIEYL